MAGRSTLSPLKDQLKVVNKFKSGSWCKCKVALLAVIDRHMTLVLRVEVVVFSQEVRGVGYECGEAVREEANLSPGEFSPCEGGPPCSLWES